MGPLDALALQVTSLRKVYGNVAAVDDVSFEIERGSVFCIIGPNGAGRPRPLSASKGCAGRMAARFSSPDWNP